MPTWTRRGRRAALALGLGLAVLLPTLACSGSATSDAPATDAGPAPQPQDPSKRIVGSWRLGKSEEEVRRLKIIDAAISDRPAKKERLGDLTPDEQRLFDEWKGKKGKEVRDVRQEIRFSRGSQFHFTDTTVAAEFGGEEKFDAVPYQVVSATDAQLTLTFDPGLGNGVETHVITWSSQNAGVDDITAADGRTFTPLDLLRVQ